MSEGGHDNHTVAAERKLVPSPPNGWRRPEGIRPPTLLDLRGDPEEGERAAGNGPSLVPFETGGAFGSPGAARFPPSRQPIRTYVPPLEEKGNNVPQQGRLLILVLRTLPLRGPPKPHTAPSPKKQAEA